MRHHCLDLTACDAGIVFEGFFAIAIEEDVWVHFHDPLLFLALRLLMLRR
jgi:hypothetical protein